MISCDMWHTLWLRAATEDRHWFAAVAAGGWVRVARGRPVMVSLRNFGIEAVADHYQTGLSRKIWVSVDTLAKRSARRRQRLRDGVHEPREFILRRHPGVNGTAGATAGGTEPAELRAGRAGALRDIAVTAPLAHAGRRASAARLSAASRSRGTHICGLEGRRHTIGMGPGPHLGPCAARTGARDSRVSVVSIEGG